MGFFDDLLEGFGDRHHRGRRRGHGPHDDHHHDHEYDDDRGPFAPRRGDPHPDLRPRGACPKCAAPVVLAPDSRFCSTCGAPLAAPASCRSCGARLAPGVVFCSACGAQV